MKKSKIKTLLVGQLVISNTLRKSLEVANGYTTKLSARVNELNNELLAAKRPTQEIEKLKRELQVAEDKYQSSERSRVIVVQENLKLTNANSILKSESSTVRRDLRMAQDGLELLKRRIAELEDLRAKSTVECQRCRCYYIQSDEDNTCPWCEIDSLKREVIQYRERLGTMNQ